MGLREVKEIAQRHTTKKWYNFDLAPGLHASEICELSSI